MHWYVQASTHLCPSFASVDLVNRRGFLIHIQQGIHQSHSYLHFYELKGVLRANVSRITLNTYLSNNSNQLVSPTLVFIQTWVSANSSSINNPQFVSFRNQNPSHQIRQFYFSFFYRYQFASTQSSLTQIPLVVKRKQLNNIIKRTRK